MVGEALRNSTNSESGHTTDVKTTVTMTSISSLVSG